MNPQSQFCHNPQCPARGQRGQGNIRVHSPAEPRYRCRTCGQTLAATRGTPFYRLHTAVDLVTIVLTLLCHGCPIQVIVAAFDLDERTVAAWLVRAGRHCQQVHLSCCRPNGVTSPLTSANCQLFLRSARSKYGARRRSTSAK
jgi:transposase-like protein